MQKWVEIINGEYIHHTQTSEFNVVTRPATPDEVIAYDAKKEIEKDTGDAKQYIDKLVEENTNLRMQLVANAESSRVEELTEQLSEAKALIDSKDAQIKTLEDSCEELREAVQLAQTKLNELEAAISQGAPVATPTDAPTEAPTAAPTLPQTDAPVAESATAEAPTT